VLGVAVLFFALWTVALKKTLTGSGGGSGNTPSAPVLQSAVNKARGLQSVVNSSAAKAGGTPAQSAPPPTAQSAPQSAPKTASPASTTSNAKSAQAKQAAPAHAASAAASAPKSPAGTRPASPLPQSRPTDVAVVARALKDHKVLALLVYNPAAADDRAVNKELASIPTHGGKVVKLTVPVQHLGSFSSLLNEVPVNFSPTLVLIDKDRQADEIAGFADSFEIAQRIDAALGLAAATQSSKSARHAPKLAKHASKH
jgi:hypothetical protein